MTKRKRITDPVHGSVLLTDLEADVLASKAFQRLHNIRQLGLAYYVFPAANYSRFSHSLGACHNASKMIDAIKRNSSDAGSAHAKKYEQALRLGALLHDLGHYPFSHATEHVVQNFYQSKKLDKAASLPESSVLGTAEPPSTDVELNEHKALGHESLGAFILETDPELKKIFEKHTMDLQEVKRIFEKSDPENTLVEIISSDLDCDRLDYLRRTSHHTGLPYGSVDTDFIVSQASLDSDFRFSYMPKAARAADHLLISRYYDYLQVPFNKTVSALEWSLVTCIEVLLQKGLLDFSTKAIEEHIHNETWGDFDDNHFFAQFRALYRSKDIDDVLRDHLRAVLERVPAKELLSNHSLIELSNTSNVIANMKSAETIVRDVAIDLGINVARFKVWSVDVHFAKYQRESEDAIGAVRILSEDGLSSNMLCQMNDMLFSRLLGLAHKGFRIFYLPMQSDDPKRLEQIKKSIVSKFSLCGLST